MDSVRPKISEVAGENDDTSQLEHIQACLVSAEEEDDEAMLPGSWYHRTVSGSRFHRTANELLIVYLYLRSKVYELFKLDNFKKNESIRDKFDELIFKHESWAIEEDRPRSTVYSGTRPAEHPQWNCPRCNSQNIKFCYYNNYSLFCKTCRRYWTEGDTLRNIPSFSATSFASNRSSSAASTSKNERKNSNNRGKTAETSPLKDPSTVGYDYKEWHLHYQTGRKYRDVGPNIVTGSGFWEPTGTNNPIHYSNATPSGPNYTSIFASMDNQPQPSEPPSNQNPARPEVRIDIFDGNTDLLIHQSWKEYKDQLKNSLCDDDAMKIMSGTLTAVAGQVIGGLMVYKITAPYSWAGSAVEIAMVLGLCVTLAGNSLRGRSRAHSALMIKIGAVITASAIVFSMGLHLPPAMALTVGPVMFLIMAVAAAFA